MSLFRVIPVLLLARASLVKTRKFKDRTYVGDPVNTAKIFNELEVDEICILDIDATREGREPDFELISQLAEECFMPLTYGGGIRSVSVATRLLQLGVEKICLNQAAIECPKLVSDCAQEFGRQAVVVSLDVKVDWLGRYRVYDYLRRKCLRLDPASFVQSAEQLGAGELLLTSVCREGSWKGFDLNLIERVATAASIPVIAHGGCAGPGDVSALVQSKLVEAAGVGSMVVFQKKDYGVLANFPRGQMLLGDLSKPPLVEDSRAHK